MAIGNLQELIPAIFTGPNGERLTPEQIAQRQEIAQSLIGRATDTRPDAGGWASVLTKGLLGFQSGAGQRAADNAIAANAAAEQSLISDMLGSLGGGAGFNPAVAAGASPTSAIATGTIPTNFNIGENQDTIRNGIIETAQAIGADPVDLATAISYETGGTFDPTKAGPTTQYGQHRGFIQFGEPQAKQYGVDWSNPIGSQLGANGAIANYFRSSGFKPGMSGLDLYSAINAGSPGRYSASDTANGGAPGSVADKWNNQMAGHRAKAQALLGGGSSPIQNMPYKPQGATGNPVQNMPYAPQQASGPALTPLAAIEQIAPVQDTEGLFAPGAQVSQADLEFARQATGPDVVSNNFNDRWNAGAVAPEVVAPALQEQASPHPEVANAVIPQQPQQGPSPSLLAQNDMMLGGALSPSGTSPVAQALSGSFPSAPSADRAPVTSQPFQMPAQSQSGGINPAIIQALSSPYVSNQGRQVASLLLGRQLDASDPMKQAELQLRQAQTQQALRKANNPLGDETFFGNPIAIQGPDGQIQYGQIGNKGTFRPIQLGEGQTFAPPTRTVDTGTEVIQMTQNGEVISRTPKQNREAAAQTSGGQVEGKTEAERRIAAPADIQTGQNTISLIDKIKNHPGLKMGTGLGSYANAIPGTPGYDFQNLVDQAKSGAFLSAIQQMRGMGSLSNAEGDAATRAVNRINTATSTDAFLDALSDYQTIVQQGIERAKRNINEGAITQQGGESKRLKFNPATGELE